jgi:hypothetical protein
MSNTPILTRPIPAYFRGPLGGHRQYLVHIALENYADYLRYPKRIDENQGRAPVGVAQYTEFRLFLTAVESMNNILDYLYYEHVNQPAPGNPLHKFRKRVYRKYPHLGTLNEMANAYKHCVQHKAHERPAHDLQRTHVSVSIDLSRPERLPQAEYHFSGPLPDDHATADAVFKFWLNYHQTNYTDPTTDDILNA